MVRAGVPAATLLADSGGGAEWSAAGGTSRDGGRTPRPTDRFRIASLTKTFMAVVLLQLVAEQRLELDAPVARYLPGVVPNGEAISIRHLMQHTSGLDDYHRYNGLYTAADYLSHRFADPSAREDLALALAHPPLFPPGTGWSYTDGNYRVLELVIEAVTGESAGTAVTRRVIRPLRLDGTWYPEHNPAVPGAYLHGYMPVDGADGSFSDLAGMVDFTVETVDQTGAAGALVSTALDLRRFFAELLGGRLLPTRQLAEMLTPVPTDAVSAQAGIVGYGLGIAQFALGDGTALWGNGGDIKGYTTELVATPDGTRLVVLSLTLNPVPDSVVPLMVDALIRAMA